MFPDKIRPKKKHKDEHWQWMMDSIHVVIQIYTKHDKKSNAIPYFLKQCTWTAILSKNIHSLLISYANEKEKNQINSNHTTRMMD